MKFNIFVGIIFSENNSKISIGIIDIEKKKITSESFSVHKSKVDIKKYLNTLKIDKTKELNNIEKFLDLEIGKNRKAKFLIEIPQTFPYPLDNPSSSPATLLPNDSSCIDIILLLTSGYAAVNSPQEVNDKVFFSRYPNLQEIAHLVPYQPLFLNQNLSKTYAELIFGSSISNKQSAIMAALLAKNRGAYYYWSSFGTVQSSRDIVVYLKSQQKEPTSVLSASEDYSISSDSASLANIEEIPLEYVTTVKKHQKSIGENDATKAALVQVCKNWNIQLRCVSWRDDADDEHKKYGSEYPEDMEVYWENIRKMPLVYPLPNEDLWISQYFQ